MSYVFGLSFEYSRYKRDAVMRIFADDHLVSEIDLTEDIKLKEVNLYDMPRDRPLKNVKNSFPHMPDKLFLFEISEQYLHSNLRIEIHNNNNNHTNGFMTKYSYVIFQEIFIIPDYMLEQKNWRILERLQDGYGDDTHNLLFSPPLRPGTFSTFAGGISVNPLRTKTNKHEDTALGQSTQPFIKHKVMGGSFVIDIPLQRKHKIVHLGSGIVGRMVPNMSIENRLWAFKQQNTNT